MFRGKHIVCPCDWNEPIWQWKHSEKERDKQFYKDWLNNTDFKNVPALDNRCQFIKYLESLSKIYNFTVDFCGWDPTYAKNKKITIEQFYDNNVFYQEETARKGIENYGLAPFQYSIPYFKKKYGDDLIIITNPPFSLFREFIKVVIDQKCNFLIIGPLSVVTYKDCFQYIKDDKFWIGMNNVKEFIMPDLQTKKFGNINWYTNIDNPNNKERENGMILTSFYKGHEKNYPKAKNMDVIIVKRVKDIPMDYEGWMYVPISFIFKYSPKQFKISNISSYHIYGIKKAFDIEDDAGKRLFMGIIIKNLSPKKKEINK